MPSRDSGTSNAVATLSSCPSVAQLTAFINGRVAETELEQIGNHVTQCEVCDAQLAELEFQSDAVVDGIRRARRPATEWHAGTIIGEYEIMAQLGVGGMGRVWKARHRRMNREVAIKVIARPDQANHYLLERFQREVEVLAALRHSNIALAFDAGEFNGHPYLVMELLHGSDLGKRLTENGPLPLAEACDYVLQAARGLAFAHARDLIHRDVKPANLFLTDDGVIKVLDLGLVRRGNQVEAIPAGSSSSDALRGAGLTTATTIMGTLDYAAPEQMASAATVDARADVYSLGCTLYALLTGASPFTRATAEATAKAHREEMPRAIEGIPTRINAVMMQMMSKTPTDRPTVIEVIAALQPARSKWRVWLLAACVLIAGAGFAWSLSRGQPEMAYSASAPPSRQAPAGVSTTLSANDSSAFQMRWADEYGMPLQVYNKLDHCMILVPPGAIAELKLSCPRPLRVSKWETTNEQFRKFIEESGHKPLVKGTLGVRNVDKPGFTFKDAPELTWQSPGLPGQPEQGQPVVQVSWDDAKAYCDWLSRKEKAQYRLPTKVEHEWFTKCGVASLYYFGNDLAKVNEYEVTYASGLDRPARLNNPLRKPNPWGLQDTLGNVREWTADWLNTDQLYRLTNGLCYFDTPSRNNSAGWLPGLGASFLGFRIVMEVDLP